MKYHHHERKNLDSAVKRREGGYLRSIATERNGVKAGRPDAAMMLWKSCGRKYTRMSVRSKSYGR